MSLISALLAGPGPSTAREALALYAKGFCMGVADIIPGVSGGTIAFITGIYEDLLAAIKSVGASAIRKLLDLDLSGALAEVHTRFLLPLLLGIGSALLLTAHLVSLLLVQCPVLIWALFFGLIAASVIVIARHLTRFGVYQAVLLLAGAVGSYSITGMIPVQTPEALWFIFLSGAIAICAMILPGISGAFLLLVLGKYEYVMQAVRNPFQIENLIVIFVFGLGCALGLSAFARILHHLLLRHHDAMVAVLTGIMLGAMRKVWPWKVVLEERLVAGKSVVIQTANVLPRQLDTELFLAVFLMAAGFGAVLLLDYFGGKRRAAQASS